MDTTDERARLGAASARRKANRLTIEEVGRLAGVSRNTVSLALAGSSRVRPETRERVLRVVQATGYRRNPAAAALAGGSTRTVGVVEFGPPAYLSDRAYIGYLAGIEEATSANGYDLLLLSAQRASGSGWLLALARARRFDGLVLLGPETDRPAVAEVLSAGVPAVHIGRRVIHDHDLPYVTPDYVQAGKLAVHRLCSSGVTHVLYVTSVNQPESKRDLQQGMAEAVRQLAASGRVVTASSLDLVPSEQIPWALLTGRVVGLIVHGSTTGMAVLRALASVGRRPPMVVYDDEGWLGEAAPGADLLRPPKRLIGYTAAMLALDLIAGKAPADCHVAVPPEASWLETSAARAPNGTGTSILSSRANASPGHREGVLGERR